MEELKRCPFCGGVAKVTIDKQRTRDSYFAVYCEDCKNGTQWHLNPYEAFKKWNRRVKDETSL